MMRANFKRAAAASVGAAVAFGLLAPGMAVAQRPSAEPCAALLRVADALEVRFEERASGLDERGAEREARIDERRETRAERRDARRDAWQERRDGLYARLEEIAEDDAEKAAVNAFKRAVDEAVQAKNAAIEAANAAFRSGLDAAIQARRDAVVAATSRYSDAVESIIRNVRARCAAGDDPKEVRGEFRREMKNAHEQFLADRREIEGLREDVQALVAERRKALRNAHEALVAALEQAKAELKEAIGEEGGGDDNATSTEE